LRTPEQIKAAKEASRPTGVRSDGPITHGSQTSFRSNRTTGGAAKTDA